MLRFAFFTLIVASFGSSVSDQTVITPQEASQKSEDDAPAAPPPALSMEEDAVVFRSAGTEFLVHPTEEQPRSISSPDSQWAELVSGRLSPTHFAEFLTRRFRTIRDDFVTNREHIPHYQTIWYEREPELDRLKKEGVRLLMFFLIPFLRRVAEEKGPEAVCSLLVARSLGTGKEDSLRELFRLGLTSSGADIFRLPTFSALDALFTLTKDFCGFGPLNLEREIVDSTLRGEYGSLSFSNQHGAESAAKELFNKILFQEIDYGSSRTVFQKQFLRQILSYVTADNGWKDKGPLLHIFEVLDVLTAARKEDGVVGAGCALLELALGPEEDDDFASTASEYGRRCPLDDFTRFKLLRGIASHTLHDEKRVKLLAQDLVWKLYVVRINMLSVGSAGTRRV